MKRLDGTAQSIPGFEMEKNWWVWSASCAQVEVQKSCGDENANFKAESKNSANEKDDNDFHFS